MKIIGFKYLTLIQSLDSKQFSTGKMKHFANIKAAGAIWKRPAQKRPVFSESDFLILNRLVFNRLKEADVNKIQGGQICPILRRYFSFF